MKVLVLNCGSRPSNTNCLIWIIKKRDRNRWYRKIGLSRLFPFTLPNGEKKVLEKDIRNHTGRCEFIWIHWPALNLVLSNLLNEINAVGHRMVHGGEKFEANLCCWHRKSWMLSHGLQRLGPLHNPANLKGRKRHLCHIAEMYRRSVYSIQRSIKLCRNWRLPHAIPYELYKKYGVRRYGFSPLCFTTRVWVSGRSPRERRLSLATLVTVVRITAVKMVRA